MRQFQCVMATKLYEGEIVTIIIKSGIWDNAVDKARRYCINRNYIMIDFSEIKEPEKSA